MSAIDLSPTYCVCGPRGYFRDDVHTRCACGAAIVHRPYVPASYVKICIDCFGARSRAAIIAGQPLRVTVSERARAEAMAYLANRPEGGLLS